MGGDRVTSQYTAAVALSAEIAEALADADLACTFDDVVVTAGEFAPISACNVVLVWSDGVADDNEFDIEACDVRGRLTLRYRVSVCYSEPGDSDPTAAEHAVTAECLYDAADAIWCWLVAKLDARDLLGCGCKDAKVGALTAGPRQGGVVSIDGTVTIPYTC